jgi:hypothetical protein
MVRNAEIRILHSLYNQAPKKEILYEKQYINRALKVDHPTPKVHLHANQHKKHFVLISALRINMRACGVAVRLGFWVSEICGSLRERIFRNFKMNFCKI